MNLATEVISRAKQYGADNPQQRNYLSSLVSSLPSDLVVQELLSVFSSATDSEESFPEQELAGLLLWCSDYRCPVPATTVIRTILPNWNLSVEQLPWYLCREFGINTVLDAVEQVRAEQTESSNNRALDTLAFWARNYTAHKAL